MENYRVVPELNEEERDLGVVDVSLYDENDSLLGKIHLTDKGAIRDLDAGKDPEFNPYATFVGCETEAEDKDQVKEILEHIFEYLAGKGVKEVSYNATNKTKEPFLKNIGFELEQENMDGFYPILIYKRTLSDDGKSGAFLNGAKQHGADSTWGNF